MLWYLQVEPNVSLVSLTSFRLNMCTVALSVCILLGSIYPCTDYLKRDAPMAVSLNPTTESYLAMFTPRVISAPSKKCMHQYEVDTATYSSSRLRPTVRGWWKFIQSAQNDKNHLRRITGRIPPEKNTYHRCQGKLHQQ